MTAVTLHDSAAQSPDAYQLAVWLAQHPVRGPFVAGDDGRTELDERGDDRG